MSSGIVGARARRTGERVVEDGRPPRVEWAWEGDPAIVAVTTAARDFGWRTESPVHAVDEAWNELRGWADGRFTGIVGARQMHGSGIFVADGLEVPGKGEGAGPWQIRLGGYDGFATARPGLLLTVGIADCVPALLRGPDAIALLHAGWRGVAADIVPRGIALLAERYGHEPGELRAWWGPSIGPCHYPVGPEVVEAITATTAGRRRSAWTSRGDDGRWRVDLRAALTCQAEDAGVAVASIASSAVCTACDPRYHSYRRASGGGGRMVAVAGIPEPPG